MSGFVNTINVLGDDVLGGLIISRTIEELKDDKITMVRMSAFYQCHKLVEVDLPSVTVIGNNAFRECSVLAKVNIPSAKHLVGASFYKCGALTSINAPNVERIESDTFSYCSELVKLDLPKATDILTKVFAYSPKFSALILRKEGVATLQNVAAFIETPIANGTGYIYVPRALVDSYKTATNWSVYASQFRALEDYTVDGTITGELDESKI